MIAEVGAPLFTSHNAEGTNHGDDIAGEGAQNESQTAQQSPCHGH